MADADHLLEDPEFMSLNPREMIEYLERLNLSDSPPCPARANLLSGLRRMFDDNVPFHQICLSMVEILAEFEQLKARRQQQQQGENDEAAGEEKQEGNSEEAGGEKQEGETGGEKQENGKNNKAAGGEKQKGKKQEEDKKVETGGEKQEGNGDEDDGEKPEEGNTGEAIFDDPSLSFIQMIESLERNNMSRPDPIPAIIDLCSFVRTMIENNVPESICMLELTSYYNYIQQIQKQGDMIEKDLKVSVSDEKMDGESCTICRKKYCKNEKIGTLDCGHAFHEVCVKNRLVRKNECPLCKATGLKRLDCVTCQMISSSKYEQGLEV